MTDGEDHTIERAHANQALNQLAEQLAIQVTVAVPDWVRRCVVRVLDDAWRRGASDWHLAELDTASVVRRAEEAGWKAAEDVGRNMWSLRSAGIDADPGAPLEIVRQAISYPTDVLRAAGVFPIDAETNATQFVSDDPYRLSPHSLAELHPLLPEWAVAWRAALADALEFRYDT